ncbi:hypothetical protein K439DRAFT_1613925 [Ramaria rubella]|nr:hypothetical protein K439DRAFT_1613925 [Ramaria rubella]
MKELTVEVSPDKQYIKISKELTQKQHIHLKTNDGLTIAFVLAADTVAEERQKLWEDLEMLAPQFLSNPFDSKDSQYVFPAYHFSHENGKKTKMRPAIDAVLHPIMKELQKHLPDIWTELEACAHVIPNSTALPGYPFASLVLNLQAITRAHKDIMDNNFCLVIPIGPKLPCGQEGWEGGHRGSLVLSTEKALAKYKGDYNGWKAHIQT